MNSFAPRLVRIGGFHNRPVWQICPEIDCLARRFIRPYSVHAIPTFEAQRLSPKRPLLDTSPWWSSNFFALPAAIRTFASQRVVINFEDLPATYSVKNGLAFRANDLSPAEAESVFGKQISTKIANQILRYIHGRRVAGTLEDPTIVNLYDEKITIAGLRWLREHVPIDEVKCAGLRAEQELSEIEDGYMAGAERLRLYKPNAQKKNENVSVYGESLFDKIRKANEEKYAEEQRIAKAKLDKENKKLQKSGGLQTTTGTANVELRKPRGQNPRIQHYIDRAKGMESPPELTTFDRLWPAGLLFAAVTVGCLLFAQVYTPPRRDWRMWPDVPPSAATILGIVVANIAVLCLWRVPPAWRMLNKYFLVVPGYPTALSLVGNLFSHQEFMHLAVNMAVLWFAGTRLHEEVGRGNFLAIYIFAGTFGSFASLSSYVLKRNFTTSSTGASGSVFGVVSAYLYLKSSDKVTLFGFPPENWPSISAMTLLVIMIGIEILSMRKKMKIVKTDHWAHLGGYAGGIGSAALLNMRTTKRTSEDGTSGPEQSNKVTVKET